jgi:epoxyqueuosine reductase
MSSTAELQLFLANTITSFVGESPLNQLKDIDGSPMWEAPLIGFADGDDPLFVRYKTVVGEFHLMPRQALAMHPHLAAGQETQHVSVVSWILPTATETKRSNAEMTDGASLRWNNTRFQGEDFNNSLRAHVVATLEQRGYHAIAPVLTPGFRTLTLANGPASSWSERHIAYAAGLGTFSLSDGLITARGVAHRCGSVVFDAACQPMPRPYSHYQEYCLHTDDGACGVCIERCPVGAIGPDGHDKLKCRDFLTITLVNGARKPGYIGSYDACGLCQTGVPCESEIPRRG